MTDGPAFLLPSEAKRASNGASTATPQPPDGEPAPWIAPVTYDQWRRYLLPVPGADPGELEPWTRVTTLAKLVGSEHGLTIWGERELLRGVGLRPSLRALLADGHDDKAVLDEVREAAKEAAGMHDARRWGTAVHTGVERAMTDPASRATIDTSEQYGRDVMAAVRCLDENGARVRLVERVVVHSTLRYAGRFDYLLEVDLPATAFTPARTVLRVFDVKTGARIAEQGQQVGAQLSAYVNATHLYDPATRGFSPLPSDLDTSTGYVLAVREGRAQLYEVDLLDGWIDFRLAVQQHRRGKAGTSMSPVGAPVVVEAPILDELRVVITAQVDPLLSAVAAQAPPVERALCPGDPQHYADSHSPGGAWFGVPLDHSTQPVVTPTAAQAAADALADVASLDEPASVEVVETVTTTSVVEVERSPSGRARRACSKCRRPGHTAKRCPGGAVDLEGAPVSVGTIPSTVEEIVDAGLSCTCSASAGWTALVGASRPDVTVCGSCALPSAATLERLRGERAGLTALQDGASLLEAAAVVEAITPTTLEVLQAGGGQGWDEAAAAAERLTPAFVPPWQAPAAPVVEPTPPTLLEQIDACASQEELGALWQATNAAGGAWTAEHTERAQQRISAGLPILAG